MSIFVSISKHISRLILRQETGLKRFAAHSKYNSNYSGMKELKYIHFPNIALFRAWLERNYQTSPGFWMIFYKKHTRNPCIQYTEALGEALCYGWIDSLVRKIDHDKYARKFTPRKDNRKWSQVNLAKVAQLIQSGKMKQAGLDKIDISLKSALTDWVNVGAEKKVTGEIEIPDYIKIEFASNEPALKNFSNLSPTYQKQYIAWITCGKREKTVIKRIKESIGLLKENSKLGLK